jgi:hypothetical protein
VVEKVSGNGGVIDLGGVTGFILTAGSVASASGVTIQSGYTNGSDGGNFRLYGATVYLNGCTVANGDATYGAGFFMATTTHVTLTNCTVPEQGTRTLYCRDNSVLTISGSTIATVIMRDSATVDIQGSNSVVKIAPLSATSPNTSVTIQPGAILDLTENSVTEAIKPGGGITLDASPSSGVVIIGSAGSDTQTRTFTGGGTITGSAILNTGAISGATVTLPSSSCQIEFVKSGETVVSSAFIQASETPYVLETQQGAGAVLVRAIED